MTTRFAGTGRLTRLGLRRDRFKIILWIVILAGLMIAVAVKFNDLYGSAADINAIKDTLKGPAMVAMLGAFDFPKTPNTAQIFANEMVVFMAIFQVIMNIALGVHATRGEEDQGITELTRSHAIGQLAPLAAAAWELVIVNGLMAVIYGVGLSFSGMDGMTTSGNWVISLGLAAISLTFGLLSLVTAQIGDHSSSATGLVYALFGLSYIVRMMTDVQNPDYTWWSPLGWIEKLSPYQGDANWLPVILGLGSALLLFILAAIINLNRDLNAGILATRAGRREASAFLRGPASLLWRREHNVIIGWIVGMAILGLTYGSVFNTIGDMLKTNSTIRQVFGGDVLHAANHALIINFTSTLIIVMATLAAIPGIQLINKLYGDETRGWLESLYALPLSRTRQFFSYVGLAVCTSILTFLASIGSLVLVGNASLTHAKDGITAFEFWQAFWGQLPSVLVFLALAALLVGLFPKGRSLTWIYLGIGFIASYMGGLLDLPKWATKLAPLGWMRKTPLHDVNWSTFSWMLALTVVGIVIGWIAYRRRDLHMS